MAVRTSSAAPPPEPPRGSDPAGREALLAAVLDGLAGTPRRIPGKFLWDEAGSVLFDRVCDSPDYYPTRCEMALLPRAAREIADRLGPGATIVEFGSGASRKVRTLLDALRAPARYVAVDISADYLAASLRRLAPDYPGVAMIPVPADYSRPVALPVDLGDGPVLGFFPGTSIGNLAPEEASGFLARARETLGAGGDGVGRNGVGRDGARLLVGADPTRDAARLLRVYGGCDGLMPALHLNLLARLNRELGAGIPLDAFRHEARVLPDPFRVEAHLVALRPNAWRLGDRTVRFAPGESVRTDTSHKHPPDAFRALAARGGWVVERDWIDPAGFGLYLLGG